MTFNNLKYKILNRKGILDKPVPNYSGEHANQLLSNSLRSERPCMIARFGAFELGMAISAQTPISLSNILKLLNGDLAYIGWNKNLANSLCNNAGFFPNDKAYIKRFSHLLMEDMKECDILGSWLPGEKIISDKIGNGSYQSVALCDLEPFYHDNPYTLTLHDKKVLVVHPYKDSILHQWPKKNLLFGGKEIIPDCSLTVIKAVQSAAGNKSQYQTWFDALEYMKGEMDNTEYDIALIGCGAYGFHLAAHAKRTGHKAIHLGGVLQILFGIMGNRWEGKYPFVNEHWIRPLPCDNIQNAKSIENGCYW